MSGNSEGVRALRSLPVSPDMRISDVMTTGRSLLPSLHTTHVLIALTFLPLAFIVLQAVKAFLYRFSGLNVRVALFGWSGRSY